MIRRDYFLRMIEEFIQVLARLRSLKQGQHWEEALALLDAEFKRLVDAGPAEVARLTETELFARLIPGEPTQVVRYKALVLVTLLTEAAEIATAREQAEEAVACNRKALNLLLETLAQTEAIECPDFVPKVEALQAVLTGNPLPARTCALLMQHYERTGQFAKAEDALFALLDAAPDQTGVIEFGLIFYQRLLDQSDAALLDGNLTRAEVIAGREELERRRTDRQ